MMKPQFAQYGVSMRANLPNREPEILKFWEENDIYQQVWRKTAAGKNSSCMTVLPMPTGISIWAIR